MYPTAIDKFVAQPYVEDRRRELDQEMAIVLAPFHKSDWDEKLLARMPANWVAALGCSTANEAIAELGWLKVEKFMPQTVSALCKKLAGLGVMIPQDGDASLLYFFLIDGEVSVFEGLLPAHLSASDQPRPSDVRVFQSVHDGWFDFFSGDVGPMPEEEWPVIGASRSDGATLIGVASKGSALAGFEPGEAGMPPRVLWPDDGSVEIPKSLFATIDEWVAAALAPAEAQDH